MNFFRGVCVLALMCAFVSCDAPRINPLDPESPAYKAPKIMGTIEGTVRVQSSQLPLEAVKVSWKYQGIFTTVLTNSNGNYLITGLERNDGWIYFEKAGYSKDSSLVQFKDSKIIQIDKPLNAIPQIEGTIRTKKNSLPLAHVKVGWLNQNKNVFTLTNSNGYYILDKPDRNDVWIYFEKEKYSKDSAFVQFVDSKNIRVDTTLNAIPLLNWFQLYTSVENFLPTIQTYTLVATASVNDDEGDVDSVMIQNRSINFYKKLPYNSSSKLYHNSFQSSDLNVSSIIETQGTNFEIVAIDRNKKKFVLGASSLTRVITQEVGLRLPANGDVISSTPPYIFEWLRFLPFFNFTFTLEIYKIESDLTETLQWEKKLISSNDVTERCPNKLSPGNYYWVIWAVDDFGNRTRSKPSAFTLK